MSSYGLFLSVLYLLHHVSAAPSNAPWKSWTFCKKQDPTKNNVCLVKAIQGVEKDMLHGNSYFGTPTLDPLHIDELSMFKAGSNDPVAVNITFKNCDIIGLSSWELQEAKADWDTGNLMAKVHLKSPVFFVSDYNVNGKVILLPINGGGKSNITFENMDVILKLTGKTIDKKGKTYFTVDTFDVDLIPTKVYAHMENLFNGNKALGDNMNKFLNENWKEIMKEVKKPISHALGEAFKQLSHRVFSKIPFDQVVPK